jgi:hypothetical protein
MKGETGMIRKLVEDLSGWDGLAVASHRFGGKEFRWGKVEIGHIHEDGMVDIPFNRKMRIELVSSGLADRHHIMAASGWITTYLRSELDFERIRNLLRLSYLQKKTRRSANATEQAEVAALMEALDIRLDKSKR